LSKKKEEDAKTKFKRYGNIITLGIQGMPQYVLTIIKGGALLTVGYTIFGNMSYSYKMYS
jgi:hypothetical protein